MSVPRKSHSFSSPKFVSSTQVNQFHTNASVPHKFVNSALIRQCHTNPSVPHKCVSSTQSRQFFWLFCLFSVFWCGSEVRNWRIRAELTDCCGTEQFAGNSPIYAELTDLWDWKGVAFVRKWYDELTVFWNWRVIPKKWHLPKSLTFLGKSKHLVISCDVTWPWDRKSIRRLGKKRGETGGGFLLHKCGIWAMPRISVCYEFRSNKFAKNKKTI